ncbi:MAG: AbrB/MazE/SpoVT family DNA-binding domain-containing protein [Candidatus Eremiobacteraeota bacterium]|nr:AbrB/MazE/SpoVT family DNA-binding domain-containing protein [Candidatus Eremiobacteraeota bacterium]
MKASIRRIGNSQGIILPKPLLSQLDLTDEVDLTLENGAIVLRKPRRGVRDGWEGASKRLALQGEHGAEWPPFANRNDAKLKW